MSAKKIAKATKKVAAKQAKKESKAKAPAAPAPAAAAPAAEVRRLGLERLHTTATQTCNCWRWGELWCRALLH